MRKFISLVRKRHIRYDWGLCRSKKKAFMVVVFPLSYTGLKGLPYGIIEDKSDFELKPIWATTNSKLKVTATFTALCIYIYI
ncbi:hypothetical protein HanOQP8_Chr04g0166221 [Helianthus annuus]|nr:hypothetical protein HanOQP8_Chr04g0166221 [Helianthus annuus]